jgi:hypothetical protein
MAGAGYRAADGAPAVRFGTPACSAAVLFVKLPLSLVESSARVFWGTGSPESWCGGSVIARRQTSWGGFGKWKSACDP